MCKHGRLWRPYLLGLLVRTYAHWLPSGISRPQRSKLVRRDPLTDNNHVGIPSGQRLRQHYAIPYPNTNRMPASLVYYDGVQWVWWKFGMRRNNRLSASKQSDPNGNRRPRLL